MDTETGASICLPFAAAAAPTPVPVVVDPVAGAVGTVSQGHTEQLALASECTSNVSASVFTDSLKDGRGTEGRRERKEMVMANVVHNTKTLLYRNNKRTSLQHYFQSVSEWDGNQRTEGGLFTDTGGGSKAKIKVGLCAEKELV